MLQLSILDAVPVYENDYTRLLTSYSHAQHIHMIPDQGCSDMGAGYAISGCVDIMNRRIGMAASGSMVNVLDLYHSYVYPDGGLAAFRSIFKGMRDWGYQYGGARYFLDGYVLIPQAGLLKRYLIDKGPCLLTVAAYENAGDDFWVPRGDLLGYHALIAVGYNPRGIEVVGTRGVRWGNCGMAILPWEYLPAVREMWGISL